MACADTNEHCDYWTKNGECQKNPVYMNQSCKKACGLCTEGCTNVYPDSNCYFWANRAQCTTNQAFMHLNCKKTCKICNDNSESSTTTANTTRATIKAPTTKAPTTKSLTAKTPTNTPTKAPTTIAPTTKAPTVDTSTKRRVTPTSINTSHAPTITALTIGPNQHQDSSHTEPESTHTALYISVPLLITGVIILVAIVCRRKFNGRDVKKGRSAMNGLPNTTGGNGSELPIYYTIDDDKTVRYDESQKGNLAPTPGAYISPVYHITPHTQEAYDYVDESGTQNDLGYDVSKLHGRADNQYEQGECGTGYNALRIVQSKRGTGQNEHFYDSCDDQLSMQDKKSHNP
ncbi:uncharacterized protein LOC128238262 [Mya arenaria]|uniref:uncharacterized protein LOC128238262 n=1 Tax=Mya arenaria TaxID=6604 RepID=UPI0022E52FC0|nr:uncharacterized protein LOC128238262 [Mya arenaria]